LNVKKHLLSLACSVAAAGAAHADGSSTSNWFRVLDWNSDGGVSLVELQAARNTRFLNMDVNKDQVMSRDEAAKSQAWKSRFNGLDQNNDGFVTLAEFESRGRSRFEAIDENRNGTISPTEALDFQRRIRANWERNWKASRPG